jgi:hypothetical protein
MKKVICLFSLMFTLVLMNTSCTKPTDDNPIQPSEGKITINQLNGTWKTIAYIYDGERYKYTDLMIPLDIKELFRTFTFYSTTKKVDFTWTSTGVPLPAPYDFTKDVDDITFVYMLATKETYKVSEYSNDTDTLRLYFSFKDGYPNLKTGTYILHK